MASATSAAAAAATAATAAVESFLAKPTNMRHTTMLDVLSINIDMLRWLKEERKMDLLHPNSSEEVRDTVAAFTQLSRMYLRFTELGKTQGHTWSKDQRHTYSQGIEATVRLFDVPSYFIPSTKQTDRLHGFVGQRLFFEAGAGSGFVARLLTRSGLRVRAVDNCVLENEQDVFHVENKDMLEALQEHREEIECDQVVLGCLCPDPGQERSTQMLQWFHRTGGQRVVTGGAPDSNAAPSFWCYLRTYFDRTETINNVRVMPAFVPPSFVQQQQQQQRQKGQGQASAAAASASTSASDLKPSSVIVTPLMLWKRNNKPIPSSALDLTLGSAVPTSSANHLQVAALLDVIKELARTSS